MFADSPNLKKRGRKLLNHLARAGKKKSRKGSARRKKEVVLRAKQCRKGKGEEAISLKNKKKECCGPMTEKNFSRPGGIGKPLRA